MLMVGGACSARDRREKRPWTFYALATLIGAFLVFLYGPMVVIYLLSFQGPDGGVTFPMVGICTDLVHRDSRSRGRWRISRWPSAARWLLATIVSVTHGA